MGGRTTVYKPHTYGWKNNSLFIENRKPTYISNHSDASSIIYAQIYLSKNEH